MIEQPLAVNSRLETRLPWIAEDPASKVVLDLARKVAETSTTLLITGESGTGKDHLARLIHELGPRRDAPFLKIDCASAGTCRIGIVRARAGRFHRRGRAQARASGNGPDWNHRPR